MARFLTTDAFEVPEKRLEHLPFRFECRDREYLLSNMVGDFVVLTHDEFGRLIDLRVRPGDGLYEKAYASHLITRQGQHAQASGTAEWCHVARSPGCSDQKAGPGMSPQRVPKGVHARLQRAMDA